MVSFKDMACISVICACVLCKNICIFYSCSFFYLLPVAVFGWTGIFFLWKNHYLLIWHVTCFHAHFCFWFIWIIYQTKLTDILAEDTSLFSSIHDENSHQNKLNNDLHKINKWASSEKWVLTLILIEKAHFSRKIQKDDSQNVTFNVWNNGIFSSQKHLRPVQVRK